MTDTKFVIHFDILDESSQIKRSNHLLWGEPSRSSLGDYIHTLIWLEINIFKALVRFWGSDDGWRLWKFLCLHWSVCPCLAKAEPMKMIAMIVVSYEDKTK